MHADSGRHSSLRDRRGVRAQADLLSPARQAPEGLLFVQTIVHRAWPYHLEPRGEDDWLARHFATGATMPSDALVLHFQDSALVEDQWALSGLHCALTAEDWLRNFDRNRPTIKMLFDRVYGPERCGRWMVYWRLFFLACAETFAYNGAGSRKLDLHARCWSVIVRVPR